MEKAPPAFNFHQAIAIGSVRDIVSQYQEGNLKGITSKVDGTSPLLFAAEFLIKAQVSNPKLIDDARKIYHVARNATFFYVIGTGDEAGVRRVLSHYSKGLDLFDTKNMPFQYGSFIHFAHTCIQRPFFLAPSIGDGSRSKIYQIIVSYSSASSSV